MYFFYININKKNFHIILEDYAKLLFFFFFFNSPKCIKIHFNSEIKIEEAYSSLYIKELFFLCIFMYAGH